MAKNNGLTQLNDREKQMFYDEVKGLIKEIQEGWKHRQVIAEKRRRDRKIQNRVDDSDSDLDAEIEDELRELESNNSNELSLKKQPN